MNQNPDKNQIAPQPSATDTLTWRTGITSLDEILVEGGIRYYSDTGLFGVIFGSAGSGKSILGLQLCWNFADSAPNRAAIFITQEPSNLIRAKIHEFCYFKRQLVPSDKKRLYCDKLPQQPKQSASSGASQGGMFVINMPLDPRQQQDKLLNILDSAIAWTKFKCNGGASSKPDTANQHMHDEAAEHLLICVDNAETIRDEAYLEAFEGAHRPKIGAATRSRHAHNFYKLIRHHFADHGINSFFIFEESATQDAIAETLDVSTTAQAYAADIVIHLSSHTFPNGYRERSLEILKAKNQFHRRGKHHFSIVGPARASESRQEVGIVLYPSIATQMYGISRPEIKHDRQEPPSSVSQRDYITLGIKSLDDEVCKLTDRSEKHTGFIQAGTNSVLVSDLDERATEIALHFALETTARKGRATQRSLYLSFQRSLQDLQAVAHRFENLGKKTEQLGLDNTAACQVCYWPTEHISEGKLLQDISLLIGQGKGRQRVVVDNIFALGARFPLIGNVEQFLAALLALFKDKGVNSLLLDTVEVGEGRNPIEKSIAAGMADNVFVLRHIEFHSQPRTVFSVLKLQGQPVPAKIWELEEMVSAPGKKPVLKALDTFEFYRDVLTGKPEPVHITMSLYKDEQGSPLDQFLCAQQRALQQTLLQSLTFHIYGAEAYARMQRAIALAPEHPLVDCHIVAIDEFWLDELIAKGRLENIGEFLSVDTKDRDDSVAHTQYITAAQTLSLSRHFEDAKLASKMDAKFFKFSRYAVPIRNNCGILAYDPVTVRAFVKYCVAEMIKTSGHDTPETKELRAWMRQLDTSSHTPVKWTTIKILRKYWKKWPHKLPSHCAFFTFCMDQMESYVTFLLELALSTVNSPGDLFQQTISKTIGCRVSYGAVKWECFKPALQLMFDLLDEFELAQLADGAFRSSDREHEALFSRQWLSTLGCLRERENKRLSEQKQQKGPRWFLRLRPMQLPLASDGKRSPTVSGTWYLGILKGSVALGAGVRVIKQFCSTLDDDQKLRNYIGLPVRTDFYKGSRGRPFSMLPYAKNLVRIADVQAKYAARPQNRHVKMKYINTVLKSDCPFYRTQIEHYEWVAPALWHMMVEAAKRKDVHSSKHDRAAIDAAVKEAKDKYHALKTATEDGRKTPSI